MYLAFISDERWRSEAGFRLLGRIDLDLWVAATEDQNWQNHPTGLRPPPRKKHREDLAVAMEAYLSKIQVQPGYKKLRYPAIQIKRIGLAHPFPLMISNRWNTDHSLEQIFWQLKSTKIFSLISKEKRFYFVLGYVLSEIAERAESIYSPVGWDFTWKIYKEWFFNLNSGVIGMNEAK
jgi:hypothetical protein